MRWTVHGERAVYESPWVSLTLVDVEIPGGERFDHHVVRAAGAAVGVVVTDPQRGVLMLWRHRFMTDTWGWEIPAGAVDPGETHEVASAREVLEETGWRPGPLTRWTTFHPMSGRSDQLFEVYGAEGAEHVGAPTDVSESERVEWIPRERVCELMSSGEIHDGMTLVGLLWWLSVKT